MHGHRNAPLQLHGMQSPATIARLHADYIFRQYMDGYGRHSLANRAACNNHSGLNNRHTIPDGA